MLNIDTLNSDEIEEILENISLQIEEIESFTKVLFNALENDYSELDKTDIKNTVSILKNTVSNLKKAHYNLTDKMGI